MVVDVDAAVAFYTTHFGFTLGSTMAPAVAGVVRGPLRILLSGPTSSAGRPMPDGRKPGPGGWNRVHFIVDDIEAEVARLRAAGVRFRSEIVTGPGGRQIVLDDPSGNPIELFQPARREYFTTSSYRSTMLLPAQGGNDRGNRNRSQENDDGNRPGRVRLSRRTETSRDRQAGRSRRRCACASSRGLRQRARLAHRPWRPSRSHDRHLDAAVIRSRPRGGSRRRSRGG